MNPHIDETVPAIAMAYARILVEYLRQRGGSVRNLLGGADLQSAELERGDGFVSVATYRRLVDNARVQLQEPALGLLLGCKLNFSTHGPLGHAVLACGGARDSIRLARKYMKIRNAACEIDFQSSESTGIYSLHVRLPVDDLYIHMVEEAIASYLSCLAALGVNIAEVQITCAFPEPSHGHIYRTLFGDAITFGAGSNTVRLPRKCFAHMTLHRDPSIHDLATRKCDSLLDEAERGAGLFASIRELLLQRSGYFPGQTEIAKALGMSTRSLSRQLSCQGTSFKHILCTTRRELAIERLTAGNETIEEIAELLGYECPPNFTRSFKQWTGHSPRNYRQLHRKSLVH